MENIHSCARPKNIAIPLVPMVAFQIIHAMAMVTLKSIDLSQYFVEENMV